MPRMNGIECVVKFKADNRLKSQPVIMYSTTADSSEVKQMRMLGAEDFIQKASSFEKLKQSIHKVLRSEYSKFIRTLKVLLSPIPTHFDFGFHMADIFT